MAKFLQRRRSRDSGPALPDVRVAEERGIRSLYLGSDTIQSSMRLSDPTELVLTYTHAMMGFLLCLPSAPAAILHIGLGGGSLPRFCHARLPDTRNIAVELNPEVIAVARSLFALPEDERLRVIQGDGVQFVGERTAEFDAVLVDASREHEASLAALLRAAPQLLVVEPRLWRETSGQPSPPPVAALMALPAPPTDTAGRRSVVLDRLQDAGNVGSILRSAAAFGVEQVIALKGCAGLWSPKVLRAAQGAHFALQLCEEAQLDDVSALEVPLLATSSHEGELLPQAALPDPCAWVFGHEGQGLSEALLQRCDRRVAIPQPGGEESLNVAAAAAVCFYESMRRRSKPA